MKSLIIALGFWVLVPIVIAIAISVCEKNTGTNPENNELNLPHCRFIYIGGCKHTWCRTDHSGGLQIVDPECRPINANVSDQPLVNQCNNPTCPTTP